MEIVQRTSIPRNRFAGVREHRLVMDSRWFGERTEGPERPGSGSLVYLADARLMPAGETGMHDHRDIDVVTLMVEGRLMHRGSLGDENLLLAGEVQIQRSGSEGFSHNEINPDESENRLIQLWVLPEVPCETAAYYHIKPAAGAVTRVYGGDNPAPSLVQSSTMIDIATVRAEQSIDIDVPCLAYLCRGKGFANEEVISEGDLVRAPQLTFDAIVDSQLIIVHQAR